MRFTKTPEEKAAGRERRAKKKADAAERRAQEELAASPVGQATAAHERGDALLQVELPVTKESAGTLARVESIGWRLEHAGFAFAVSGDSDDIGGDLIGVYLFRAHHE